MRAGRRELRRRSRSAVRDLWEKSDSFFYLVVTVGSLLALALLVSMPAIRHWG